MIDRAKRDPWRRAVRRGARPAVALLALALVAGAGAARAGRETTTQNRTRPVTLPTLVSLVFHHSTRGVYENALPRLQARNARATLGLVVHELEHTLVPPDDVSTADAPGGLGNVQPISLGEADGDGLYAGRLFLERSGRQMTDDQIRAVAAAGWEIAFHGVDHTAQSSLVEQVDGPGKLARAYAAGVAEIRRLLGDPTYPVRTNTLAANGWSAGVREVAAGVFDWTEVRWTGGETHVPVVYDLVQEPHGGFNSIDFRRDAYDGPADLDGLARLAASQPGAWLILQLHDVVDTPEDSPHPPTAITVAELEALLARLDAVGASLVTFSEGAAAVSRNNAGNRLRNTRFGTHGFLTPPREQPLDWNGTVYGGDERSSLLFGTDGSLRLASPDTPARLVVSQRISPWLLRGRQFVLDGGVTSAAGWSGRLTAAMTGPMGTVETEIRPGDPSFCLAFRPRDIEGGGAVSLRLLAEELTGQVTLTDLSLTPRRGRDGCD